MEDNIIKEIYENDKLIDTMNVSYEEVAKVLINRQIYKMFTGIDSYYEDGIRYGKIKFKVDVNYTYVYKNIKLD